MIDLTRKTLPNTVTVGGKVFSINTDYRLWMRFEIDLIKRVLPIEVGYLFRSTVPEACRIEELMPFLKPPEELPRGEGSDVPLIDFEIDSDYIYSAFLGQYGIDLLTTDMHWHIFLALIKGLNDTTRMREIMGYRSYTKAAPGGGDRYEKLRAAWAIERLTPEQKKEIEDFSNRFN